MLDLQPDRSVIRNMLEEGWRFTLSIGANRIERIRWLSFEDFILGYMNDCVEYICSAHHIERIPIGNMRGRFCNVCEFVPRKIKSLP